MRILKIYGLLLPLLLVFMTAAVNAAPATQLWDIPSGSYVLRMPQSKLLFFVDAVSGAAYQGEFKDFAAKLDYDTSRPGRSNLNVTVDTTTATMDSDNLTDTLRGEDFFNVVQFPKITFVAHNLKQLDSHHGEMTGDVTLLGVTKPLTLQVEFIGAHYNAEDKEELLSFHATAKLHRSDFGMDKYTSVVHEDVELMILTEFVRSETSAP